MSAGCGRTCCSGPRCIDAADPSCSRCALGVWQMERRAWKRDILDRIADQPGGGADAARRAAARAIRCAASTAGSRVSGSFLHDKEFYLAARSLKDKVGMQVVTPLRTDDGTIVLFDRGWIPSEKKDPAKRAEGQLAGKVELVGIVRRSQIKRQFAPDNDPAQEFLVPCRRAGDAPDGGRHSPIRCSTASSSTPTRRPIPAACRSAARPGSTSPTTICNTPSPGS